MIKRSFFLLMLGLLLIVPVKVCAQSADTLISAVNALRFSYGLEPYVTDAGLMSLAQAQSEIGRASCRERV